MSKKVRAALGDLEDGTIVHFSRGQMGTLIHQGDILFRGPALCL